MTTHAVIQADRITGERRVLHRYRHPRYAYEQASHLVLSRQRDGTARHYHISVRELDDQPCPRCGGPQQIDRYTTHTEIVCVGQCNQEEAA